MQPLKDVPTEELLKRLEVYRKEFEHMISPPDETTPKERKKLFERMLRNIFSPNQDKQFTEHLEVIHELWIRNISVY